MIKIKALLATVGKDLADTWKRSKMVILALLGIAVAIEVHKIEEESVVKTGQKEIANDNKKDAVLATQEKTDNDEANALMQKATEETSSDDWNKS